MAEAGLDMALLPPRPTPPILVRIQPLAVAARTVTMSTRTTVASVLFGTGLLLPMAAGADVRVFHDLEAFEAATAAAVISAPYPAVDAASQLTTLTSGEVEFFRAGGGLYPAEWTQALPGNDLAISGREDFDLRLSRPHHHAAGLVVFEPSCSGCIDSVFTVRVIGQDPGTAPGTPTVLREVVFQPIEDAISFIGFASDLRMVRLEVRETVGSDDNEFFGAVHGRRDRPESIPAGHVPRILEMNQPVDFPVEFAHTFDFDLIPTGAGYLGVALDGIEVMATGGSAWRVEATTPLGGRAARQPDAMETWTVSLPPRSRAVDFRLWESSLTGGTTDSCFETPCYDTRYLVEAFNGSTRIWSADYSPWNDRPNRLTLWSTVAIDRLEIRAEFNNSDDELLGDIRAGNAPLPPGYPQRLAPAEFSAFGEHAAIADGRAVIAHADGIELWRESGGLWAPAGAIDLAVDVEAMDFDGQHLVVAGGLVDGTRRLHVIRAIGDDPSAWPMEPFDYLGSASAVAVDGDLAALGLGELVRIYRRDGGTWQFAGSLLPASPVPGIDAFGRDLGIDGDLLVVGADDNVFYLYRDDSGGLTEIYRQDQPTSPGTPYVDVAGDRVAQQEFAGAVMLYTPDTDGEWGPSALLSQPLPFLNGLGLGNGVRIAGDHIVTLRSFWSSDVADFRQAVSIWTRRDGGDYQRDFVIADPHLSGGLSSRLGSFGDALAHDGQWMLLGHPGTPWCAGMMRDFFGDAGVENYRAVCQGRSGAAFIARLADLGLVFRDRFAPP